MSRRGFLLAAGGAAAAVAAQMEVLDFASSLFAGEPKPAEKPLVSVAFALRTRGGKWYPSGTAEMLRKIRAQYEAILFQAAKKLDVRLDVMPELLTDGSAYLGRVKKTSPDSQILMALDLARWAPVLKVLQNRRSIPTIVYANVSTNRMGGLAQVPREPGIYLGSTHDVSWLKYAMTMLSTLWRAKRMRILRCPGRDYDEAFKKVTGSAELRAVADFYTRSAKKIVEPTKADILQAARHYIVLRGLIRQGNYDGVTVSGRLCTGAGGPDASPACLAVSRVPSETIGN